MLHYAPPEAKSFLVDPNPQSAGRAVEIIAEKAATGVPALVEKLIACAAA